jgi:hypothetical protein
VARLLEPRETIDSEDVDKESWEILWVVLRVGQKLREQDENYGREHGDPALARYLVCETVE